MSLALCLIPDLNWGSFDYKVNISSALPWIEHIANYRVKVNGLSISLLIS